MGQLSIEEGNKLIAEFMGVKVEVINHEVCYNMMGENNPYPLHTAVKYHSSWDWLMPVVEKIEGKEIDLNVSVVIKNDNCGIYRHKGSAYEYAISDLYAGPTKIEATWKAIIEFIQWYQTQNKQV